MKLRRLLALLLPVGVLAALCCIWPYFLMFLIGAAPLTLLAIFFGWVAGCGLLAKVHGAPRTPSPREPDL